MLKTPIFARAFVVALILGSILTAINQPGAILGAASLDLLPFTLVYITPFVVVTASQILGIRQALRDGRPLPDGEDFLATVWAHGIPSKALLTGLLVGTVNTAITVAAALFETGSLADIPLPLLFQAYTLPVLFGLLSQTISYRRAAARFAELPSQPAV
jgi:hypothetical protein